MSSIKEIDHRSASANESPWVQRKYLADDYSSESAAMIALNSYLISSIGDPPNINALSLRNIYINEVRPNTWTCVVSWGVYQRPYYQMGDSYFSFEFQAVPVRIILPTAPQRVYKRASDSADVPTILLIDDQGIPDEEPKGCEIIEPSYAESETHYINADLIDQSYKDLVGSLVGKVNNSPWKGKDEGEVLLTGVTGSRRSTEDWEVNFQWAIKKNQYNKYYPGVDITVAVREGWEYIWPKYNLKVDDDNDEITRRDIRYLVVAPVYEKANMFSLGIGG